MSGGLTCLCSQTWKTTFVNWCHVEAWLVCNPSTLDRVWENQKKRRGQGIQKMELGEIEVKALSCTNKKEVKSIVA